MDDKRNPNEEYEDYGISDNYISLTDEDGKEQEYRVIDTLDLNDDTYVALEITADDPVEYLNSDGNLLILKVIEEDGEEILATIDDDDELDEVLDIFMSRLSDLYEFDDEEDE